LTGTDDRLRVVERAEMTRDAFRKILRRELARDNLREQAEELDPMATSPHVSCTGQASR
jgi:hypothetical protein